jgi:hypothetical protein
LLEAKGIPLAVAQWLGPSLAPGGRWAAAAANNSSNGSNGDQKLDWVFDIQGAAALYNSYRQEAGWLIAVGDGIRTTNHCHSSSSSLATRCEKSPHACA